MELDNFDTKLAQACGDPGTVIERRPGESAARWTARAVRKLLDSSPAYLAVPAIPDGLDARPEVRFVVHCSECAKPIRDPEYDSVIAWKPKNLPELSLYGLDDSGWHVDLARADSALGGRVLVCQDCAEGPSCEGCEETIYPWQARADVPTVFRMPTYAADEILGAGGARLSEVLGGDWHDGARVTVSGALTGITRQTTRQGRDWATARLVEVGAEAEVTFFPVPYASTQAYLADGAVVSLEVTVDRRDAGVKLNVRDLNPLPVERVDMSTAPDPWHRSCREESEAAEHMIGMVRRSAEGPEGSDGVANILHTLTGVVESKMAGRGITEDAVEVPTGTAAAAVRLWDARFGVGWRHDGVRVRYWPGPGPRGGEPIETTAGTQAIWPTWSNSREVPEVYVDTVGLVPITHVEVIQGSCGVTTIEHRAGRAHHTPACRFDAGHKGGHSWAVDALAGFEARRGPHADPQVERSIELTVEIYRQHGGINAALAVLADLAGLGLRDEVAEVAALRLWPVRVSPSVRYRDPQRRDWPCDEPGRPGAVGRTWSLPYREAGVLVVQCPGTRVEATPLHELCLSGPCGHPLAGRETGSAAVLMGVVEAVAEDDRPGWTTAALETAGGEVVLDIPGELREIAAGRLLPGEAVRVVGAVSRRDRQPRRLLVGAVETPCGEVGTSFVDGEPLRLKHTMPCAKPYDHGTDHDWREAEIEVIA